MLTMKLGKTISASGSKFLCTGVNLRRILSVSAVASLKKFLEEKGFERYKGSRTYFKLLHNKCYAIAEIYRDRNHVVYNSYENCFHDTNRTFYDIHIDIWYEGLNDSRSKKTFLTNFDAGNSICRLSEKNELEWVNLDGCSEHKIVDDIKSSFDDIFYNPLFLNESPLSIYDFLCKLDMIRCGDVFYNSRQLLFAALEEKRYSEAMFCLKCILAYYTPLEDNIEEYEYEEIVDLLTDEMIDRLRDDDNRVVKSLIDQYDDIADLLNGK